MARLYFKSHFLLEQTAFDLSRICLIAKEASWWRWETEKEQRKRQFYSHKLLENGQTTGTCVCASLLSAVNPWMF